VTSPADVERTLGIFREIFLAHGLSDAWKRVVGLVIQPGVEFGDAMVHDYQPTPALTAVIDRQPGLAYEALERAKREKVDVLMIDTAGRLQNKKELMDELAKIVRVLKKLDPEAPHATLLVLDATVGQNAISQADAFRSIAGVTGIVMTKLDGTARGGVLVALAEKHALPIHFIGVGESADDLQPFSAAAFARALAGLSSLGERG
ncbi:MAG TPA: class II D-tagatose-bisphosphate aldolase, non-catalytic subunit, partial [Parvularculaceae bacterium]|nr:class II D-tagatose-bisphosphate aldolase, non-catalytic subunit [Parvularculaceae bacterium]